MDEIRVSEPLHEIQYRTRELGYGSEEGIVQGRWDHTRCSLGGGPAFVVAGGETLHLFDDEVLSDEVVASAWEWRAFYGDPFVSDQDRADA